MVASCTVATVYDIGLGFAHLTTDDPHVTIHWPNTPLIHSIPGVFSPGIALPTMYSEVDHNLERQISVNVSFNKQNNLTLPQATDQHIAGFGP